MTGLVVTAVVSLFTSGESSWRREMERAEAFVGSRFARVWHDPAERRELAQSASEAFQFDVMLFDADGRTLEVVGNTCERHRLTVPVRLDGRVLGKVVGCQRRSGPGRHGWIGISALLAACLTIWAATFAISRKLSRPLSDLVRVTREIGSGKLSSRVRLGRHHRGEVGVLAEAVNDMAVRIERQMSDQRELLAAVSHEIRSPLARLRVLVELARDRGAEAQTLADIEREIVEIDALVGKLLANSRLEFEALSFQKLSPKDLALRALDRAGLPAGLLVDGAPGVTLEGDATLLSRALGNLLENAARHAGGAVALTIERRGASIVFEVADRGPGFPEESLKKAFDPFFRHGTSRPSETTPSPDEHGSLGLGLSLVARIAQAHRGRAWAENRADGGARVSIEIPIDQSSNGS